MVLIHLPLAGGGPDCAGTLGEKPVLPFRLVPGGSFSDSGRYSEPDRRVPKIRQGDWRRFVGRKAHVDAHPFAPELFAPRAATHQGFPGPAPPGAGPSLDRLALPPDGTARRY